MSKNHLKDKIWTFENFPVGSKFDLDLWNEYQLRWKRLQFEVFFGRPCDVLLGVTYANIPVSVHLTFWWPLSDHWSMRLKCEGLCGMEV